MSIHMPERVSIHMSIHMSMHVSVHLSEHASTQLEAEAVRLRGQLEEARSSTSQREMEVGAISKRSDAPLIITKMVQPRQK